MKITVWHYVLLLSAIMTSLRAAADDDMAAGNGAGRDSDADIGTVVMPQAVPTAGVVSRVDDRDFDIILERPLFSPSRRPPPPAKDNSGEPVAKVESAPPDFKLLGIVTADGQENALVKIGSRGGSKVVAPGEELEGWLIKSITRTAIELEKSGDIHKVKLQRRGSSPVSNSGFAGAEMMPPGITTP